MDMQFKCTCMMYSKNRIHHDMVYNALALKIEHVMDMQFKCTVAHNVQDKVLKIEYFKQLILLTIY